MTETSKTIKDFDNHCNGLSSSSKFQVSKEMSNYEVSVVQHKNTSMALQGLRTDAVHVSAGL